MTPTVAVVTDSAASLPAELAEAWGIVTIPMQVIVDDEATGEGGAMSPERVLSDLVDGKRMSTSQPSPDAFVEAYRRAAGTGASDIVAVLISGAMSGTVNAATSAAQDSPVPVTVVDSRTVAMATGFSAIAAAAVARQGADVEQVVRQARRVAESSLCVFTVDTLEYMRRGGRVSPAVAAVGRMLSVRPVLGIVEGEVELLERVRTTVKARQAMLARMKYHAKDFEHPAIAIMTLGEADYGDDAARTMESADPSPGLMVQTSVSAVLAVHCGPGTLAGVVADVPPEALEPPQ